VYLYGMLSAAMAGLVAYRLVPVFSRLLIESGALRPNYQGRAIPLGVGFVFLWTSCLSLPWLHLAHQSETMGQPVAFVPLALGAGCGFGLLGLFDDLLGSRQESGLKGHSNALLAGRLTSGAIKALFGVGLGVALASYRSPGEIPLPFHRALIIIDGGLIAGSANLINLLDLRPGRAAKVFLLGSLVLLLGGHPTAFTLLPWIGSIVGYLPFDLKGQVMMGDTGANALGATLGLVAVYTLSWSTRLLLLAGIFGIHLLAEHISLSLVIERCAPLRILDGWGRPNP